MNVSGNNMNENNVNNTEVPVQQPVATPVQQPAATPVQQEISKPMQTIDSNEKNINPNAVMEKNINVGANAPEEYGGYYAWGDIKTKRRCFL